MPAAASRARDVGVAALAAATVVGPVSARAQDLARVSYQYLAPADVDANDGETVELTTHAVSASFLAPAQLAPRFTLLAGASYGWLRASGVGEGTSDREDLHEVGVSLGGRIRVDPRWTVLTLVAPSLASDFEDLGPDAINLRAVVRADVQLSEPVSFSFGVVASYVLGALLPLPVLGLDWMPGPADRLTVQFPTGVRYAHLFADRVELGAALRLRGNRYAVDRGMADALRTTTLDAGAEVAVRLAGPLWLEVLAGAAVFRNFEVSDDGREGLFDSRVEPGLSFETALVVRPLGRADHDPDRAAPSSSPVEQR